MRVARAIQVIRTYENWPLAILDKAELGTASFRLMRMRHHPVALLAGANCRDVGRLTHLFCDHPYTADVSVRQGGIIMDVGANLGFFASYMHAVHNAGTVYCYEPDPDNFSLLTANVALNNIRATAVCAALVEGRETEVTLWKGKNSGKHSTSRRVGPDSIGVEARSIGDEVGRVLEHHGRLDFLKVDTEGSEAVLGQALSDYHVKAIGCLALESDPVQHAMMEGLATRLSGLGKQVWFRNNILIAQ